MTILDTNVISELMKPAPSTAVIQWFEAQRRPRLFTSAPSMAEVFLGVQLLPRGKRREGVESAARLMFEVKFEGKVLPFDSTSAALYAEIVVRHRKAGRPISFWDAQIASIARSHGAALATRDVRDFEGSGIEIVNPWES
jgi:toxin FitB